VPQLNSEQGSWPTLHGVDLPRHLALGSTGAWQLLLSTPGSTSMRAQPANGNGVETNFALVATGKLKGRAMRCNPEARGARCARCYSPRGVYSFKAQAQSDLHFDLRCLEARGLPFSEGDKMGCHYVPEISP